VNLITDTAPPSSQMAAQTLLSALTTIVVNEPTPSDKAKVTTHAQKPLIIDEMTTTTTTLVEHVTEIHKTSEELTAVHDANTGELNNEVIETDYESTYNINQVEDEDDDDEERRRQEFAGNYTDKLVLSALFKEQQQQQQQQQQQRPISDELKHLLSIGKYF
jgi:hypothetical protein